MRFSLSGPMSREQMPALLHKALVAYGEGRPSHYLVLDRSRGDVLGSCGFIPFQDPDREADYETTYRFISTCWGRGMATEAVQSLLEHGFDRFNLPAVAAVVEKENVASVRVLEKVGMACTGEMRSHGVTVMRFILFRGNDSLRIK